MKKLIAILAALLMVFTFAACSDDDDGGTGGTGGTVSADTSFKAIYSAITTSNYDGSFDGTTTIAQLKTLINGSGFVGGDYNVRGVCVGIENYNGNFSDWNCYIQDSTGGIYVSINGGSGLWDATAVGKVISLQVSEATNLYGYNRIIAFTSGYVATSNAPSAIYVKDISTTNNYLADMSTVVRYAATIDTFGSTTTFTQTVPNLYLNYCTDTNWMTAGVSLTVVGPMTSYNGLPQVSVKAAVPQAVATYATNSVQ